MRAPFDEEDSPLKPAIYVTKKWVQNVELRNQYW